VTTEGQRVKRLMRYKIISGRVVEKRDVLMEVCLDPEGRQPRPRGKRRGRTLAAQLERNMHQAVQRLARILNCNFRGGDVFLTLKYSDRRLPATKEEAKREARNFVRRIARAYSKATGKKLRWALVTADRSSKTGKPVRLHHHLVMDAVAWELVAANWPEDQFSLRHLDGTGDYTGVARYMIANAGYERKVRTWSTSQGLEKPVFTQPEPVKGAGSFQVPKEARISERVVRQDEESGFYAAYIRYVLPKPEFLDTTRRGRTGGSLIANPEKGGGGHAPV